MSNLNSVVVSNPVAKAWATTLNRRFSNLMANLKNHQLAELTVLANTLQAKGLVLSKEGEVIKTTDIRKANKEFRKNFSEKQNEFVEAFDNQYKLVIKEFLAKGDEAEYPVMEGKAEREGLQILGLLIWLRKNGYAITK